MPHFVHNIHVYCLSLSLCGRTACTHKNTDTPAQIIWRDTLREGTLHELYVRVWDMHTYIHIYVIVGSARICALARGVRMDESQICCLRSTRSHAVPVVVQRLLLLLLVYSWWQHKRTQHIYQLQYSGRMTTPTQKWRAHGMIKSTWEVCKHILRMHFIRVA